MRGTVVRPPRFDGRRERRGGAAVPGPAVRSGSGAVARHEPPRPLGRGAGGWGGGCLPAAGVSVPVPARPSGRRRGGGLGHALGRLLHCPAPRLPARAWDGLPGVWAVVVEGGRRREVRRPEGVRQRGRPVGKVARDDLPMRRLRPPLVRNGQRGVSGASSGPPAAAPRVRSYRRGSRSPVHE